ncbi:hypothetical protein F5J12DRAFT_80546 [Pisolithus orientalis]|uniref:uncharacterized protein n=1 Tax=Pisolithus orientalis TaxID=936130 RepID=UPI0022243F4F|nr:uncharacterized protein F5J12DRAFT_80546 [Pisolithus orientalis]KAI6007561.1 hypothetical protein F5J12DRAFT_80546 [Pisolithus orientalis]
MTSSTDKATVVTACEQNVDVTVTEGDSRDTETKADAAKEAKNETPTPTKTSEKPEDNQSSKGNEDEKTKPSKGDDDHGKDAEQEKQTNDGEDQTKNADKEESTKDGDDQSKDADLLGVFSDSESKGGKGTGESWSKLTLVRRQVIDGFCDALVQVVIGAGRTTKTTAAARAKKIRIDWINRRVCLMSFRSALDGQRVQKAMYSHKLMQWRSACVVLRSVICVSCA